MHIEVGAYISDLLFEHNTVTIPDFGSFSGSYKSSTIEQVQGKLSPPSREITFNENLRVDDGVLTQYVKEKHQLSYEEAQRQVEAYVAHLKTALEKREIIVFPDVGRLYRDFEQKLQFLPDTTNFNPETHGLPAVQYYPVVKKEQEEPVAATTAAARAGLQPGWLSRYLPLVIGIGVVILALAGFFAWRMKQQKQQNPTAQLPADRVNVKPPRPTTEEPTENEVLDFPPTNNNESSTPSYDDTTTEEQSTTDNTPEQEAPAAEDDYDDTSSEAITPNPDQQYAVIAIGIFSNKANVDKLVKEIYKAGFEPYTEKKGSATRVGAQFSYDDQRDIQKALQIIRDKFEPDAFILKK